MTWKCPKCRGDNLTVVVEVEARLFQDDDGNFETEPTHHHEWGSTSFMRCRECDHCGNAGQFEVTP